VPMADQTTVVTEQGHSLGRPTRAEIQVGATGGQISTIRLVATGAVVMRGSFHFNRRVVMAAY
jgi:predicted PhzF superfamily epimerase YddE/YHI9